MSGELGAYNIVDGNMGDRNDLLLWWSSDKLVGILSLVALLTLFTRLITDRTRRSGVQKHNCDRPLRWTRIYEMEHSPQYHWHHLRWRTRGTNWSINC
jgi:hypothetical protein